ncbi:MAG: SDR family oxidoreductase [Aureliella sp.]
MSVDVNGKVVLVTGANRGIGKAIVDEALQRGAKKVYAAVRNPESVASLVEANAGRVAAVKLDLADQASIEAAANQASDVEIVVNNAGVLRNASAVADDAIESLQFELEANVFGLLRVAKAFAPVLKANGGGGLAQLNSVASLKSFPDFATYSASKAASYSLTQGLRASLDEQGTAVVSVHPGPIATDMANEAGLGEIAEPPSLVAESIFDAFKSGDFHAFPDSMAKQFGEAYHSFASAVVESDLSEASEA